MLDLQLYALRHAGCDDIYTDTVSGLQAHKPNWEKLLAYARPGDTVVVWRLDRLGRSTKHLIEVVEDLSRRQLHLISLQDPIDRGRTIVGTENNGRERRSAGLGSP